MIESSRVSLFGKFLILFWWLIVIWLVWMRNNPKNLGFTRFWRNVFEYVNWLIYGIIGSKGLAINDFIYFSMNFGVCRSSIHEFSKRDFRILGFDRGTLSWFPEWESEWGSRVWMFPIHDPKCWSRVWIPSIVPECGSRVLLPSGSPSPVPEC